MSRWTVFTWMRSWRMAAALRHRGPDDEGFYSDNHAALAHTRLSIIDLSTGRQPLANEDETIWIVFNGEIYNFQELRKELEGKGHRFRTATDTEAIVHLYEEEGENCLRRLRGMFALAIWDSRRRRLLLRATDSARSRSSTLNWKIRSPSPAN